MKARTAADLFMTNWRSRLLWQRAQRSSKGKHFGMSISQVMGESLQEEVPEYQEFAGTIKPEMNIHLSKTPLALSDLKSTPEQAAEWKPKGFWYGKGSAWVDWVLSEMPQWRKQYVYEVDVDYSQVLRIRNEKEFNSFAKTFGTLAHGILKVIDWGEVAQMYSGIEIAPYLWAMRSVDWYYGWDVASGCIWDKRAIKGLKLIKDWGEIPVEKEESLTVHVPNNPSEGLGFSSPMNMHIDNAKLIALMGLRNLVTTKSVMENTPKQEGVNDLDVGLATPRRKQRRSEIDPDGTWIWPNGELKTYRTHGLGASEFFHVNTDCTAHAYKQGSIRLNRRLLVDGEARVLVTYDRPTVAALRRLVTAIEDDEKIVNLAFFPRKGFGMSGSYDREEAIEQLQVMMNKAEGVNDLEKGLAPRKRRTKSEMPYDSIFGIGHSLDDVLWSWDSDANELHTAVRGSRIDDQDEKNKGHFFNTSYGPSSVGDKRGYVDITAHWSSVASPWQGVYDREKQIVGIKPTYSNGYKGMGHVPQALLNALLDAFPDTKKFMFWECNKWVKFEAESNESLREAILAEIDARTARTRAKAATQRPQSMIPQRAKKAVATGKSYFKGVRGDFICHFETVAVTTPNVDAWQQQIQLRDLPGLLRQPRNRVPRLIDAVRKALLGDLALFCNCLTGDTKVSLLDGRERTLDELLAEYGTDKQFWVYACNEDGDFVPTLARCTGELGRVNSLAEVVLDNGETIRCTPDHEFIMRDGSRKQAKDLAENDSLMPLYRNRLRKGKYDYERTKINSSGKWALTHVQAGLASLRDELRYAWKRAKLYEDSKVIVHHMNFHTGDNRPDNLVWLTDSEHSVYHVQVSGSYKENFKLGWKWAKEHAEERTKFLLDYTNSPLHSARTSKRMKKLWADPEWKAETAAAMSEGQTKSWKNPKKRARARKSALRINADPKRKQTLRESNLRTWANPELIEKHREVMRAAWARRKAANHKVASVQIVNQEVPVPVYCLTTDCGNFAVGAGVFVANCPSFKFWGYEFLLTNWGEVMGPGEHRPPVVRNPKQQGSVCKHLYAILQSSSWLAPEIVNYLRSNPGELSANAREALWAFERVRGTGQFHTRQQQATAAATRQRRAQPAPTPAQPAAQVVPPARGTQAPGQGEEPEARESRRHKLDMLKRLSEGETGTPEFKRWFDGSKVVDASGNPLVVYHATDQNFSVFDKTRDIGYHFATKKAPSKALWKKKVPIREFYLKIINPLEVEDLKLWQPTEVFYALRDRKILPYADYTDCALAAAEEGFLSKRAASFLVKLWTDTNLISGMSDAEKGRMFDEEHAGMYPYLKAKLADAGYDGFHYKNKYEGGEAYVAIDPKQILPLDLSVRESRREKLELLRGLSEAKASTLMGWIRSDGSWLGLSEGKTHYPVAQKALGFTDREMTDGLLPGEGKYAWVVRTYGWIRVTGTSERSGWNAIFLVPNLDVKSKLQDWFMGNQDCVTYSVITVEEERRHSYSSHMMSKEEFEEWLYESRREKLELLMSLSEAGERSPEFKRFFGDWEDPKAFTSRAKGPVSFAVTKKGSVTVPRVLYHGTTQAFSKFDPERKGKNSNFLGSWETQRAGFFFAETPEDAEAYAEQGANRSGSNIMPVYVDIKSPANFTDEGANQIQYDYEELRNLGINTRWLDTTKTWELFDDEGGQRFVAALKAIGYDGAYFDEENPDTGNSFRTWVAFDKHQIKSAIGNRGTYDRERTDIGEARREKLELLRGLSEAAPDTPEFKRWFGNSKIVDEQGKPLVVYHATAAPDFSQFRARHGQAGIHFGTPGQAANRLNYVFRDKSELPAGSRVYPVYLRLVHPLRMPDIGDWTADNLGWQLSELGMIPHQWHGMTIGRIRDILRVKGYDGIVYKNAGEVTGSEEFQAEQDKAMALLQAAQKARGEPTNCFTPDVQKTPEYLAYNKAYDASMTFRVKHGKDSYIVFSSNQIKSAIGNRGTYSQASSDIGETTMNLPRALSYVRNAMGLVYGQHPTMRLCEHARTQDLPTIHEDAQRLQRILQRQLAEFKTCVGIVQEAVDSHEYVKPMRVEFIELESTRDRVEEQIEWLMEKPLWPAGTTKRGGTNPPPKRPAMPRVMSPQEVATRRSLDKDVQRAKTREQAAAIIKRHFEGWQIPLWADEYTKTTLDKMFPQTTTAAAQPAQAQPTAPGAAQPAAQDPLRLQGEGPYGLAGVLEKAFTYLRNYVKPAAQPRVDQNLQWIAKNKYNIDGLRKAAVAWKPTLEKAQQHFQGIVDALGNHIETLLGATQALPGGHKVAAPAQAAKPQPAGKPMPQKLAASMPMRDRARLLVASM